MTLTELGYLDGVTSSVQDQLDAKGTVSTLADLSVTSTATELNILDGVTSTTAELNILDGVTATAAEINTLDGITATVTELNYVDGVTSSVQDQLDAKQAADDDLTDLADGTLSASKVENNEYFITSAGSSGQVWTSDGDGAGSWATNTAATSVNGLTDALVEDNSLYLGQDPSSTTDGALRNVSLGVIALDAVTTGDNNVAIGYNALTVNTTGSDNMGVGYNALKANVGGTGNSAIGSGSLASNTGGNYNTAVGSNSLNDNAGGDRNVGIGNSSLRDNSSGNDNTAVGKSSGQLITTGDDNVTIGHESGILLTTGNKNVILGSDSDPSAEDAVNQATIGYGVTGQANNSVTLGNADVTAVYMAQDQGATVYAAGVDITGSGGLVLENDESITNSVDGTIVIDGKTDFNDNALTGYGADLQTESGTSKTLAASDNGTIIVCSSNSSITITVPASLPAGFNCMIIQNGSGQVSLSASSTTLNNRNGSKTAGQYAILTLVHLGSDVFVVSGDTTS